MYFLPGEEESAASEWRERLLANIHGARAELLNQMIGLDEAVLRDGEVFPGWSAHDLLVHVARWDALHTDLVVRLVAGRSPEPAAGRLSNDAHRDAFHHLSVEQALALALKERGGFLRTLESQNDETLQRRFASPGGWAGPLYYWAARRYRHDAGHAADLRRWRSTLPSEVDGAGVGPGFLLRAALRQTRKAFLAAGRLVPAMERVDRPLDGAWALKDWLGHLADWDAYLLAALEQIAVDGRVGDLGYDGDYEKFNREHAAARRKQPWTAVVDDFMNTRRAVLALATRLDESRLHHRFLHRWGRENSVYKWLLTFLDHEREHTSRLQVLVGLDELPPYEQLPLN